MCAPDGVSIILRGDIIWFVSGAALRCLVSALVLRMIALPPSMARAQTGNSTRSQLRQAT